LAAIRDGVADPGRVSIVGFCFGGYSAAWALTNTDRLYRCGVTIGGICDWKALVGPYSGYPSTSELYEPLVFELGDPRRDSQLLWEISPINHVDRIKVPVLVIGRGHDDECVPEQ
jgi:dipeptidyl aminopeptidase/acylaminoacyl peptidase